MFPRKAFKDPEERVKQLRKGEREGIVLYLFFNIGTIIRTFFEGFIYVKIFYYISLSRTLFQLILVFLFSLFYNTQNKGTEEMNYFVVEVTAVEEEFKNNKEVYSGMMLLRMKVLNLFKYFCI